MATWDTKEVISQAVGRLVKWECYIMVLNMCKRVWRTQKAPRIIKIEGFKGLRGVTKDEHPNNRALLIGSRGGSLVAPLWTA